MLTALQGHFTKNMFESSETPTRTGTVTVNCSVYCRSNDGRTKSHQILAKYQQWRCASESDGRLLNVHFQSYIVPEH